MICFKPLYYRDIDHYDMVEHTGMSEEEIRLNYDEMVDFLIQQLSTVDYQGAARYFGGFDKMIAAFDVTTGSEYDISEEFVPEPDLPYRKMAQVVEDEGYDLVRKKFLSASPEEIRRLIRLFRNKTFASERQIRRFLHLHDK